MPTAAKLAATAPAMPGPAARANVVAKAGDPAREAGALCSRDLAAAPRAGRGRVGVRQGAACRADAQQPAGGVARPVRLVSGPWLCACAQQIRQQRGLAARDIPGRGQQGDRPAAGSFIKMRQRRGALGPRQAPAPRIRAGPARPSRRPQFYCAQAVSPRPAARLPRRGRRDPPLGVITGSVSARRTRSSGSCRSSSADRQGQ
jgi:hypothetical protein